MERKDLAEKMAIASIALSILLVVLGVITRQTVFVFIGSTTTVLGGTAIGIIHRYWDKISEITPTTRRMQIGALLRLGSRLIAFGFLFAYFGDTAIISRFIRSPSTTLTSVFLMGGLAGIGFGGGTVVLFNRLPTLQKMTSAPVGIVARVGATVVVFLLFVVFVPVASVAFAIAFLLSRLWAIATY